LGEEREERRRESEFEGVAAPARNEGEGPVGLYSGAGGKSGEL
jgi:hypothetical protein